MRTLPRALPIALVSILIVAGAIVHPAAAQTGDIARSPRVVRAPAWQWRGLVAPDGAVAVEIVRGEIQIERVSGREISIVARRSAHRADPASVVLVVDTVAGGLRVRDVHPRAHAVTPAECLPDDDGRGDFWHDDVRLHVVLRIPHGVRVAAHVMDGQVNERRARVAR